jgi:nitroimidazol reductase NimA-like FMN-containing flavoprotein (pyridoxamine 5'-phosphate oxidase superfamily)
MPGMRLRDSSPWTVEQVTRYLHDATEPVRLACLGAGGAPLVCSLWYLFDGEALWCASQADAVVLRRLGDDPRVGFEVAGDAPPYKGVRGQGRAELRPADGARILAELLDRYQGGRDTPLARWLLARADREVAVRIDIDWLTAWDYSARMAPAATPRSTRP